MERLFLVILPATAQCCTYLPTTIAIVGTKNPILKTINMGFLFNNYVSIYQYEYPFVDKGLKCLLYQK
jgi:hypothetical protein